MISPSSSNEIWDLCNCFAGVQLMQVSLFGCFEPQPPNSSVRPNPTVLPYVPAPIYACLVIFPEQKQLSLQLLIYELTDMYAIYIHSTTKW